MVSDYGPGNYMERSIIPVLRIEYTIDFSANPEENLVYKKSLLMTKKFSKSLNLI